MLAVKLRPALLFLVLVCTCTCAATTATSAFCPEGQALPPFSIITPEEAEERKCCLDLPCKYATGCWAGMMPPLYSAPRQQAITREQANQMRDELLAPAARGETLLQKTSAPSMPEHEWWRISVPKDRYSYFYDGVQAGFRRAFNQELRLTRVDLDLFFVDDFDERWASDETYETLDPGAAYWTHNDCRNFNLCYSETGYSADDFTGNGVAFVLPVALPSETDFRDGHVLMPAALELYNISNGHRDSETNSLVRPPNRQWMEPHRYNLGEMIFFNAFRWHSGHVPRAGEFDAFKELNTGTFRSETVGFAGEHKDGFWVLFRMCKGSTDDKVKTKILKTDANPSSTGVQDVVVSQEEIELADAGLSYKMEARLGLKTEL